MKKELWIVLGVIVTLLCLPIVAVASLTDVSLLSNSNSGATLYTGNASTTNTYIFGYCTFWVAERRIAIGKPIPNNWGDAHNWDDGAKKAGYIVDRTPTTHAIMQTDAGELGHVAFVEEVKPDGTWRISEMNVKGWNVLSERTFKAADAQKYNFIH